MKSYSVSNCRTQRPWDEIEPIYGLSYPCSEEAYPRTEFRAYIDIEFLHIHFIAHGSKPMVYVRDNNKMEVMLSERVELFFRSNDTMQPYYCLEMDPTGRILDYKANLYRQFDYNWSWPTDIFIRTNIEENFYSLEAKISLHTLRALDLINNSRIEAGVFRGHCISLNGNNAQMKWLSWVDPKTSKPDFHVPAAFGCFMLDQIKEA